MNKHTLQYIDKLLKGVDVEWKTLGEVCRFINGRAYKQPELLASGKYPVLRVGNFFTNANWYYSDLELEADLVVLVTGMVPRADNKVGTLFKLPKGRDRFFNEVHMKLRPVETVIDGVTIAGSCQGPKNISESVNSALSSARVHSKRSRSWRR